MRAAVLRVGKSNKLPSRSVNKLKLVEQSSKTDIDQVETSVDSTHSVENIKSMDIINNFENQQMCRKAAVL